jgi:hypothetical protein
MESENKKKKGRQPKETKDTKESKQSKVKEIISNIKIEVVEVDETKKKGRKPKGGKLIAKPVDSIITEVPLENIILHLKCSSKDLIEYSSKTTSMASISYTPNVLNIMTYNANENENFSVYGENANMNNNAYNSENVEFVCKICKDKQTENEDVSIKDINTKLKKLKINLYKNNMSDKKSACFWCTYEYDNPACYIPKYETDKEIFVYGSFCRPECAAAHLLEENIDDSTKFERYHLLNQIYGKIYNYNKNIKPAPNPYYTLDKFYGTLTIQEYRKLLKTEHMLLVIEKPLTRILPELHEETDETILNISSSKINVSSYKVKRQSEKVSGPSKSNIMLSTFGITQ